MARRPSTESESSQKENLEPVDSTQRENMDRKPQKPNKKRRVVDEEESDRGEDEDQKPRNPDASQGEPSQVKPEDDGEAGEDEDDEDDSPRGKKRARVNEEGDAVDADADAEPRPSFKARRVKLQRDTDGFVTGSIMRMKLDRFLTYDDVEFRTSSHLNMILGPNGTGKSSIACAICLGLNQSPLLLGRAKEPAQYIKNQGPEGSIELELKGPIGKPNVIIKRVITRIPDDKSKKNDRSKSSFFLNGESATARAVSEKVTELGVHCGNLCTFLPQDRVAEFAKMTPRELLKATQEAAGDPRLSTWHKKLIEDSKELRELTGIIMSEEEQLQNLESRNAQLERDVKQYHERRDIEKQLELLDLILPAKEYIDSKREYEELKSERATHHERVMELQARNKPFIDFKENLQEHQKSCENEKKRLKIKATNGFASMTAKCTENDRLEQDAETVNSKLDSLKDQEKKRKEKISQLQRGIAKARHDIDNPPEMEDIPAIDAELRSNAESGRSLGRDKLSAEEEVRGVLDDKARQEVLRDRAKTDLSNLESVAHRKLEELSRSDRDTADAVVWLRANRNRFRMEVVEPAILSLSVPDGNFAAAIEACLSYSQFRMFVAQCREDYKLMNRLFNDTTEALGRKVHIAVWHRNEIQMALPPLSPEELIQEGFQKYALDCVIYPEGMKWFLMRELNLHRTAIALDPRKVDTRRAIDLVSRYDENGKGGGASFVAGRIMSIVTRSRYGKRLPTTQMKEIGQPRFLRHAPVDPEKKREILSRIADAQANIEASEVAEKSCTAKLKEIEEGLRTLTEARNAIKARKDKVLAIQRQLQTLKLRIVSEEKKLEDELNAPSIEDKRQRLRKDIFDIAKKRVQVANELQEIAKKTMESITKATRAGLEHAQAAANLRALEELCETRNHAWKLARDEFEKVTVRFDEKKKATKRLLEISKQKINEVDDELRDTFQALEAQGELHRHNVEDIKTEQENLRARLELLTVTNPGVIEQFKLREEEIARYKDKLEKKSIKRTDLDKKIKKIREKWYPSLQELIEVIGAKFSEAFDNVGCAGEIRIAEHEYDYDQWAIEILVKFRDTENLQVLTGTRQSGGERALTTIMYLMSLTQMARSPFSLVDEINQGMDNRYERAVHNALVDVTCEEDSGQYFLITPKLLSDLKYHERMKVLCVTNGEWLPETQEERCGDMKRMIENYVKHHRQA